MRDKAIVGEGFHLAAGLPHAEAAALGVAGPAAENATAYVTLEPCSHWGRMPPCADALVQAKVSRVVVATLDDNPKVSGQGIEKLRAAGISVDIGIVGRLGSIRLVSESA